MKTAGSDFYELILSHVQKRINLNAEQQRFFCSLLTLKHIPAREYLLRQGEFCYHENYVCSGFLRSFYADGNGNEHTLHFAMEDWWITDATSFLRHQPATRNIVTLEASVIFQIDARGMEEMYKQIPAFEKFWRLLNQSSSMAQDQRILSNIAMNGAERYQALIKKYPTLEQRMPQKHIASYLGITPVFLSQIRGKKNSS